jgi:hypothetical protein
MRFFIDNSTTRLFAVVGAPYIPESHFEDRCEMRWATARRDDSFEAGLTLSPAAAGWWPQACR